MKASFHRNQPDASKKSLLELAVLIRQIILIALIHSFAPIRLPAAEPEPDPPYAFRTDFANQHLPWYQPKPLEFPPHHHVDLRHRHDVTQIDQARYAVARVGDAARHDA